MDSWRNVLLRVLLTAELALLIATTYFFWHLSSFPAESASTGIETTEWLWVAALLVPAAGVGMLLQVIPARWQRPRYLVALIVIGVLLFGLYLQLSVFSSATYAIDRADWFWLLSLLLPVYGVRLLIARRLWTPTPLDIWFVAFLVLGVVSVNITPEVTGYPSRGFGMLMRPLLGFLWVLHLVELARVYGGVGSVLRLLTGFSVFFGYYALSATQWDMTKSAAFSAVIRLLDELPQLDAFGTANPNELGGVLALLLPVCAGTIYWFYRRRAPLWLATTVVAFIMLLIGLLAGQSRSGLIGVGLVLPILAAVLIPAGWWRRLAFVGILALVLLEAAVLMNILPLRFADGQGEPAAADVGVSNRDVRTTTQRLNFWETAAEMVADYPLTGVGMNMYRDRQFVRVDYPIEGTTPYPPHAHNAFVQMAADMGLPGLFVYVMWFAVAGYMLWVCWCADAGPTARVALAAGCGLLAYVVYSMADTIPVWDRSAFVFWLILGTLAAQYRLVNRSKSCNQETNFVKQGHKL
ncbi:MAG: O-antigen ligase family protein [Chloroflexota bacterium]